MDAIVAPPAPSASSSEPFAAVFGALRERLQSQIGASDATTAEAARLNASTAHDEAKSTAGAAAMLARLAAEHAGRAPTDPSVAPRVENSRSNTYRERRRGLLRRRERLEQRGRVVRTALDATLHEQLQRLQDASGAYRDSVEVAHANALRRLQALCVECVTEIHKAVDRAKNIFTTRVTTDEEDLRGQKNALRESLQWRIFLARLGEDTQHELRSSILMPSSSDSHRDETSQLAAELARVIATNGPVLSDQDGVVIDKVVAVAGRKDAAGTHRSYDPRAGGSRKPSLHFVHSMGAAWSDLTSSFRPTMHSSSKPRRSTPPVAANEPVQFSTTSGNDCSALRRVVAAHDARVSPFALDTTLSCSAIQWLLGRCVERVGGDEVAHQWRVRDANVYVGVSAYRGESSTSDIPSEYGDSPLAQWVRQRDEQIHSLVRGTDERATGPQASVIVQDSVGTMFVRATLLELLQTSYAREQFLPLLDKDIEAIEHVNPQWLRVLRTIPALYVAVESSQDVTLRMVALDTTCLHEMCVLYIVRGVCTKKSTRRNVVSLVKADAFSVLPPAKSDESKFCLVRSSPALVRAAGELLSQDWLGARPILFVEYHLESLGDDSIASGGMSNIITATNKKREVLRLLGPVCAWRSCLDAVTQASPGHGVMLCDWHKSFQSSVNDSAHFLPNLKDLKACLKPMKEQQEVETVKKVLIKSSSLLEVANHTELTSRQLGLSIAAFLEHAKLALSNTIFEDNLGYRLNRETSLDTNSDDGEDESDAVSARLTRLETMKQVLIVEQAITAALHAAIENGYSPLPLSYQCEWSELDSDIRTDNYELVLELSRRKLALLQTRRHEKNGDSTALKRLAHSLSDGVLGRRGVERDTLAQLFPRPQQGDMRARARQQAKVTRPQSAAQRKTDG